MRRNSVYIDTHLYIRNMNDECTNKRYEDVKMYMYWPALIRDDPKKIETNIDKINDDALHMFNKKTADGAELGKEKIQIVPCCMQGIYRHEKLRNKLKERFTTLRVNTFNDLDAPPESFLVTSGMAQKKDKRHINIVKSKAQVSSTDVAVRVTELPTSQ